MVDESPYSVAQFAREIGRTRESMYDLFEMKSIDIDLLCKISVVLMHNYLDLYYEEVQNSINENRLTKITIQKSRKKKNTK